MDEQSIQELFVYVVDNCELPEDLLKEIDEKSIWIRRPSGAEKRDGSITDIELAIQLLKTSEEIIMGNIDDEYGNFASTRTVFISHSHSDNAIADEIYNYLSMNGLNCWIDLYDIPLGIPYAQAIMEGLQSSDSLVVLYSKNVIESHDMLDEIQEAHTTQKRIIPFLLDDTPMIGQFRYYLARRQWIKAYPVYDDHLKELLYALKGEVQDSKYVENATSHRKSRGSLNDIKEKKKSRSLNEIIKGILDLWK